MGKNDNSNVSVILDGVFHSVDIRGEIPPIGSSFRHHELGDRVYKVEDVLFDYVKDSACGMTITKREVTINLTIA